MSQTKAQLLDNIKDNVQLDARNSLRFADTDSSHYVAFKAPATVSSNVTWTLPAADGRANYVLATDGSGTLSWIADPAGQWTTSGSNIYFTGGNVGIGDSSPSNPLSVTGASAFNGDLTLTGSSYNVVWDKSDNALEFADNAKAVFGAGSDLEVYHSGSHSYIKDTGTGDLFICSDDLHIGNAANSEDMAVFKENGAVELYYDNSKRIETTSYGLLSSNQVRINSSNATTVGFSCGDAGTGFYNSGSNAIGYSANGTQKWNINSAGDLSLVDGVELKLGTGDDLVIKHDSANTYFTNITGDLVLNSDSIRLRKQDGLEDYLKCIANGAVELYHNGTKKLSTENHGLSTNITNAIRWTEDSNTSSRSWQLIGEDGAYGIFELLCNNSDGGTIDQTAIKAISAGAVELYYNGAKVLYTNTNGATVHAAEGGDANLYLHADEGDDDVDKWLIQSESDGYFALKNNASGSYETSIKATGNGSVDLYWNNAKKLDTYEYGVNVTGNITTTSHVYWGDNGEAIFGGSSDMKIFHDTTGASDINRIRCKNGHLFVDVEDSMVISVQADANGENGEVSAKFLESGPVELYHNGEKKVVTSSSGLEIYGTDGGAATLDLRSDEGAHGADMFRFHVDDGGPLYIKNYEAGAWENNVMIEGDDGGVHLYYDNTKVFQTGPNPSNVRVSGFFEALWDQADAEYVYNGSSYAFHKAQNSNANWVMSVENSNNSNPYGFLIKYSDASPDNNTEQAILFADNAASRFIVYSDGDAWTSDAGTLTSDETLKENITDATSKLEDIKKLKVRNFNWKASYHPEKSKKKQIGFIAQEVEEVFPSLVSEHDISPDAGDKDHTKIMKKAIKAAWDPIIIKAMQELITKVETLETKVAALESA